MKTRGIIVAGIVITVALVIFSIFVVQPAKPLIDIKSEKLVTIASSSNDAMTFAITNTLFTAWVVMAALLAFCFWAVSKRSMVPSGIYNLFEAIIEAIFDFVTGIAGDKNGRRFFPVIATFFIYITFANWFSLTPLFNTIGVFEPVKAEEAEFHERALAFKDSGGLSIVMPGAKDFEFNADECADLDEEAAVACREEVIAHATEGDLKENEQVGVLAPFLRGINTDLMTPLSFALVSAFFVEWWGISSLGFLRYSKKFLNFSGPIDFFVGFLETIAELARLISFSFRLFGNMMAGEILLLVMTFLVAVASPIVVIFYGLEMFVGAIQAFVFGSLTLVFAVLAVTAHDGEGHGESAETAEHH